MIAKYCRHLKIVDNNPCSKYGTTSSTAKTYWQTGEGWQNVDPTTDSGLLLDLLKSAWDHIKSLESERDRWMEVATSYRIGKAADGYRLYNEIVEEDR